MDQKKVATSESGSNSTEIIPQADPVYSQEALPLEPETNKSDSNGENKTIARSGKPALDEQIVDQFFHELDGMLIEYCVKEKVIRKKIREMLEIGIHDYLGVKPTAMLDRIAADGVSDRQKYRHLHAAINEWKIGIPPNSLTESHSREMDKLKTPEEKQLAYQMCLANSSNERLTAKHFKVAVKRVIETRFTGADATNDGAAIGYIEFAPKSKRDASTYIYKKIAKSGKLSSASLYKNILELDKDDMAIIHAISSAKLLDTDKTALALLLMKTA